MIQSQKDISPQFPLYIPSKGRSEYLITSKALTLLNVPHFIIVEPQEVDKYRKEVSNKNLLTTVLELDLSYKQKYELCDDLGLTKSTGPGPARNFAWDHSKNNGFQWHWVMDDNIRAFRRLNQNEKIKVSSGSIFRAMEDFVLRYENIGMAGPNYSFFAKARQKIPPFIINTRIYSCNLIRNDLVFRWRGRYNEDTILSLDMLKGGWCTVQFNAFLQDKMQTQSIGGGNTQEFYHSEGGQLNEKKYAVGGTFLKSKMQVDVHPDVSRLVYKFGREHHYVDYSKFKSLKLIKKANIFIDSKTNEYQMQLKKKNSY